jgi:hypothetical protein
MRKRTMKISRALAVAFMLLSIAALNLPTRPTVAQTRWCDNCAQQCWNEANTGENNEDWWKCRDAGGSVPYCDKRIIESYYNGCVSTTCNYGGGCSIPLIY